ncbi:MAG: winged helix-turn-helix domain-containing protein [Saprospiraceae bacterium]|nr:winged helix-turn-helix domain-containing protein [Saprospiraceae bacterium]
MSRWLARYDADNPAWYKSLPPGGTQSKLGTEDLRRLVEELNKGCTAQGFEGEIWTRGRVGVVIERLFGVKYDPSHVGRLLKKVGWSLQRPSKQARQRSEERVQKWYAEDIGRIKKK